MKKYLLTATIASLFIIPNLYADTNLATDSAGEKMEFTGLRNAADTEDMPDFEFQPSPQVNISGATESDEFTISAYHDQATKEGGEAYAMNSDVSGLFTLRFSDGDDGSDATITAADGSELGDPWIAPTGATVPAGGDGDGDGDGDA